MKPSFNLIDKSWVPCLMPDQTKVDLGLKEVLLRSHEIREIIHTSPLVVTALYRLLLTILHRNFGPATVNDWKNLWRRGKWDRRPLEDYFFKWHEHFDLFHPERPFYQVPPMADAKTHPVQILAIEAASGNNPTLFDHNYSNQPQTFSPSQAACYVIARQSFSIGFGKSKPFYFQDSSLIRGYSVFIMGKNLWETLALNLQIYNSERPIPQLNEDLPLWEQDPLPEPNKNGTPIQGYLHYLTWPSRRIHLFPSGNPPVVQFCQIQQYLKLPDPQPLDPFKCYRKDEKEGWTPIGLRPEKALWRDSHTLFQEADQSSSRPEILNWIARIERLQRFGEIKAHKSYQFNITGIATERKAANVILWRQERLPLPLAYLEEKGLLDKLKQAITLAEEVERVLLNCIWRIAKLILSPDSENPGGRTPDPNEVRRLQQSLRPRLLYWSKLDNPFRKFLVDLAEDWQEDEDGDLIYGQQTLPDWARTLRQAANHAFQETTRGFERSVRTLKAIAKVEAQFWLGLETLFKPYKKEVTNEPTV